MVFYLFYTRPVLADRRFVLWPSAVLGTLLAFRQVSLEVMHTVQYYRLEYQVDFAVSLSRVIIAGIIFAIGMVKDIKGFRFIALALFGITHAYGGKGNVPVPRPGRSRSGIRRSQLNVSGGW